MMALRVFLAWSSCHEEGLWLRVVSCRDGALPQGVQKSFPLSTGTGHSTPLIERIDKVLLQTGKMLHERVVILGRSWEHKSKRAGRMVETEYQNPEKGPFLHC